MSLLLVSVLSAAALAAAYLFRHRALATERPVSLLARTALGPKSGIVLVEFDGRRYLVGYGEGIPSVLAESPVREEATP